MFAAISAILFFLMRKKTKSYVPVIKDAEFEIKDYVIYHEFESGSGITFPKDDSFVLLLLDSGRGTHRIDDADYQIKPRQVQMISPGQVHHWEFGPDVKGKELIINRALTETFSSKLQFSFTKFIEHAVLDLDQETYKQLNIEFLAVKTELGSTAIFTELANARCRLIALMITVWAKNEFGDVVNYQSNPISYKFHVLVEKHYRTQKSVSFYANHLCITSNYLGIICRKQFHMSALEMIQERIVLEAKRLLHSSKMSIKEIAFHLGFKNLVYFSYFFKAKTTLTPSEYRTLMENW